MIIVAINNITFEPLTKYIVQNILFSQPVPAVQKLQPIALGVCNAFVHGVVNALVGLADPVGEVVSILLNQLAAAVGAAAVDDNPLVVGKRLLDDTVDGALQPFAVIEVDGDNG